MRSYMMLLCVMIYVADLISFDILSKIKHDASSINGEKYLVIIVPSYNNSKWVQANLVSIFAQQYSNYSVIFIDDCSTDDTYQKAQEYVEKYGQSHRVYLIKNEERKGALSNIYYAVHACPDKAIIITLDGDDWFPLNNQAVLQRINQEYTNPQVWLTYGQFITYPRNECGICRPIPDAVIQAASYRKEEWVTSHLRTFYAGLFKKIRHSDLMYEGNFFDVTWDQAFMFPMLEMAHGHVAYIDDILYVYNQANPLNDFRQKVHRQLMCERFIRRKEPYQPLSYQEAQCFCPAA